jgi:hypothetical protein
MARGEDPLAQGGGQLRVLTVLSDVGEQRRAEGAAQRLGHPLVEHDEVGSQVAAAHRGAWRRKGMREGGDDQVELGRPAAVDGGLAGARPVRDALDAEAVEAVLGQLIEGSPVDGLFQRLAAAARAVTELVAHCPLRPSSHER